MLGAVIAEEEEVLEFLLTDDFGVGVSGRSRRSMFLIARIVADGGVFSPRIALVVRRLLFRREGVSRRKDGLVGVGVTSLEVDLSGEANLSVDLLDPGVTAGRSGDESGVRSNIARISLTALFCND